MRAHVHRLGIAGIAVLSMTAIATTPAWASPRVAAPTLHWKPCGQAEHVFCTTARVPLDYAHPRGGTTTIFLAKSLATDRNHRIGSLFFNYGGPGSAMAQDVEAFGAALNPTLARRFDLVAMDPRGVGQSTPVNCHVNQEKLGIYSHPFTTPHNLNTGTLVRKDRTYIARCLARNPPRLLKHLTAADVARDMDLMRRAMHQRKISVLVWSYATAIGATYARLFPTHYRAMVIDSVFGQDRYLEHPFDDLARQSTSIEKELSRFLAACKANQVACEGFGGADPKAAYDQLVARANAHPLRAHGSDPRPVDGEDILAGTVPPLYSKWSWPDLAHALATAQNGDGTAFRGLADSFYGRLDSGSYSPAGDAYFLITAGEQFYPKHTVSAYLRAGRNSFREHPHVWWNNGYVELNYGLYPIHAPDVYTGPWTLPRSAKTPLINATTHDPATPYAGALTFLRELGKGRLLTMNGDGHGAFSDNSPCIDRYTYAYLFHGALPPPGTVCQQQVPFLAPAAAAQARTTRTHFLPDFWRGR